MQKNVSVTLFLRLLDGGYFAGQAEEEPREPFVEEAGDHLLAADADLAVTLEDAAHAFAGAGVGVHAAGLAGVHLAMEGSVAFEGIQADGGVDAAGKDDRHG